SSLVGKLISSVSFLDASVVNVSSEKSHFLSCTQLVKPTKTEASTAANNLEMPSNFLDFLISKTTNNIN
ncbi:hypothetical protein, partial [Thermoflexibacter ruber]